MLFLGFVSLSLKKGTVWVSPEYEPVAYRKLIVLAKFDDAAAGRAMEDAMVRELKSQGIEAITSYLHISAEDLSSEENFIARANALGVDGLVAFTSTIDTEYKNGPSVNAHVGVPVRVGFFRVYLGGNVPIAGGVQKTKTLHLKASFYNSLSHQPQFEMTITGKIKNVNAAVKEVTGMTASELHKNNIL